MDTPVDDSAFKIKLSSFVGKIGLGAAFLLMPPVFSKWLAAGELLDNEIISLWIFSAVVAGVSLLFLFGKKRIQSSKSLIYFTFLLLISCELLFRLYAHFFFPFEKQKQLADECNFTYPANTAYVGHPFLQFTGRPSVMLKGSRALSGTSIFNNMGFGGADFNYEKPSNFIRIACLGESTTADGWPQFLEHYLNDHRTDNRVRYEVLNFAHAYWTSAHGAVNMLLNITDFNPDYIIIHHGWNENIVRDAQPGEFRSDYFHDLKAYEEPVIYDRYPIRFSMIYRDIKFQYNKTPEWMSLQTRIHRKRKPVEPLYQNPDDLKPFRRNIENIINIALLHHIRVMITTIPHSTNPEIDLAYTGQSLDQCNAITKELAEKYSDQSMFVDLDSLITGKRNDIFTDLGHVTDAGRNLKAAYLGDRLLAATKEEAEKISEQTDRETVRKNDIEFYSARIRNTPAWLNDVKNKASKKNIAVETMILTDAKWMAQQDSIKFFKKPGAR